MENHEERLIRLEELTFFQEERLEALGYSGWRVGIGFAKNRGAIPSLASRPSTIYFTSAMSISRMELHLW